MFKFITLLSRRTSRFWQVESHLRSSRRDEQVEQRSDQHQRKNGIRSTTGLDPGSLGFLLHMKLLYIQLFVIDISMACSCFVLERHCAQQHSVRQQVRREALQPGGCDVLTRDRLEHHAGGRSDRDRREGNQLVGRPEAAHQLGTSALLQRRDLHARRPAERRGRSRRQGHIRQCDWTVGRHGRQDASFRHQLDELLATMQSDNHAGRRQCQRDGHLRPAAQEERHLCRLHSQLFGQPGAGGEQTRREHGRGRRQNQRRRQSIVGQNAGSCRECFAQRKNNVRCCANVGRQIARVEQERRGRQDHPEGEDRDGQSEAGRVCRVLEGVRTAADDQLRGHLLLEQLLVDRVQPLAEQVDDDDREGEGRREQVLPLAHLHRHRLRTVCHQSGLGLCLPGLVALLGQQDALEHALLHPAQHHGVLRVHAIRPHHQSLLEGH